MRDVDRKSQKAIEEAETRLQKFMRDFDRFYANTLDEILEGLREGKVTAIEAAKRLGALHEKLREAGLGEQIAEIERLYAYELRSVAEELAAISAEIGPVAMLSDVDIDFAEALVTFDVEKIENRILVTGNSLRSEVMRQVLGPGGYVETRGLREEYGKKLGHQIETEIRTGVSSFHQTLINNKAQELDFDLWVYIGPLDKITRPLCRHILETQDVWTSKERKALNNHPTKSGNLPVETYGGGYNCRHQWSPISEKRAKRDYGYNGTEKHDKA